MWGGHADVGRSGVAAGAKSRGDGRRFLSITPRRGFWWVLIGPRVPYKQYGCEIGAFFIENGQNSCWESVVPVKAMGFKEMPFKTEL